MVSRENISLSKAGISMSVRNEAKVNSNTQRFIVTLVGLVFWLWSYI